MKKALILLILPIFLLFSGDKNLAPVVEEVEAPDDSDQFYHDYLSRIVPKCHQGDPQSCYELALFVTDETLPYQKHPDEAIIYYTKACNKNHYDACANLSTAYSLGKGTEQNYFKAIELSRKGCKAGHGLSCYNLAAGYYNGHGVRIDRQHAQELFGKACDLKFQDGCDQYANMVKR